MVAKAETEKKIPLAERVLRPRLKPGEIGAIEIDWEDALEEGEVTNKEFCELIGGLVSIYQETPKGVTTRIFVHDKCGRIIELGYFPGVEGMGPRPLARVGFSILEGYEEPETGMSYFRKIITVNVKGEKLALLGNLKSQDPGTKKSRQHPLRGQGWVLERHPVEPDLLDTLKTVWAAYQHSKVNNKVGKEI